MFYSRLKQEEITMGCIGATPPIETERLPEKKYLIPETPGSRENEHSRKKIHKGPEEKENLLHLRIPNPV